MATAAQVCATYEKLSDGRIAAAHADRAVNFGQAAGGLPKGRRGGGKGSAHWGAEPLVTHCIMLAILSHDVAITEAAQIAADYLNIRPTRRVIKALVDAGGGTPWRREISHDLAPNVLAAGSAPMLPGSSLREALVSAIAGMASNSEVREELRSTALEVELLLHERAAQISRLLEDGTIVSDHYEAPHQLQLDMPEPPQVAFRRTTTIPFPMLEMLADLLADTLARQAFPPASQPRGTATPPESDNADPSGNGPAPSGQPYTPERAQAETLTISEPTGRARVRASNLGWPPPKLDGGSYARRPNFG